MNRRIVREDSVAMVGEEVVGSEGEEVELTGKDAEPMSRDAVGDL